MNVRFGDGYVEKAKAFKFMQQMPSIQVPDGNGGTEQDMGAIIKIDLFKQTLGSPYNMIFTKHGLYNQDNPPETGSPTFTNLFSGTDYHYTKGFISTKSVPNNDKFNIAVQDMYIICSEDNDIYYWDSTGNCKKLEGTYEPTNGNTTNIWSRNTHYSLGDMVIPATNPNINGYVFRCMGAGTTSSNEPNWDENKVLGKTFTDGTVSWGCVGTYGLEGTDAKNVKAKFVEYYKGFTFLANLKEGGTHPSRVRWSQLQNPRLWHNNEDHSGMAGYVDVDDVEGDIVQIKKLNDSLIVYKEKGIVALTFTGGDTVFSKEVITTKTGLLSSSAIVEMPHSHVFIGEDNIYEFDGNSVTPIGDAIKNYFFGNLIPTYKNKIIGYYDKDDGDILFVYDRVDAERFKSGLITEEAELNNELDSEKNRNIALTYNVSTRTWAKREMYITAIGEFCQRVNRRINDVHTKVKDTLEQIDSSYGLKDKIVTICGDQDGNLYFFTGYTDSRQNYYGYFTSKTHHMNDPAHIKRLLRIQFHIHTTKKCTLFVEVGTSWNSEEVMKRWETHNITLDSPIPPFVDVDLSARYFQIRFGTKGNDEYFKVLGYTLYYQTRSDE